MKTLPDFLDSALVPELHNQCVLIWSGSLDLQKHAQKACASVLSGDELDRAVRFKFEKDQNHFVAARGVLRFLLGWYGGLSPEDVTFEYGEKGKPELVNGLTKLKFNVSHSHGLGVWALGLEGLLGVDVEWTKRRVELDRVGKRFFSAKEWAEIDALSGEDRREGFFRCWTRKEAFVKALGDGISFSLKAFDVSVGDTAKITRIQGDHDPKDWMMHAFEPAKGYVGALAFKGLAQVSHHELSPASVSA